MYLFRSDVLGCSVLERRLFMLSVAESAEILGVSSARIRALIASGKLPAKKVGRIWVLDESDVMGRAFCHPRAGRPRNDASFRSRSSAQASLYAQNSLEEAPESAPTSTSQHASTSISQHASASTLPAATDEAERSVHISMEGRRRLFEECKRLLKSHPSSEVLKDAKTAEEAAFYVAVSDFFLQQKQQELVRNGVY